MTNHENTRPAIIPIDKNALFDALYDNEFQTLCPLDEVDDVIAAAPTLDYAPVRHGAWIEVFQAEYEYLKQFHEENTLTLATITADRDRWNPNGLKCCIACMQLKKS